MKRTILTSAHHGRNNCQKTRKLVSFLNILVNSYYKCILCSCNFSKTFWCFHDIFCHHGFRGGQRADEEEETTTGAGSAPTPGLGGDTEPAESQTPAAQPSWWVHIHIHTGWRIQTRVRRAYKIRTLVTNIYNLRSLLNSTFIIHCYM